MPGKHGNPDTWKENEDAGNNKCEGLLHRALLIEVRSRGCFVDAVMTMRYADAAAALGVAVDTPMDEVKKAYFRLAMKVRAGAAAAAA